LRITRLVDDPEEQARPFTRGAIVLRAVHTDSGALPMPVEYGDRAKSAVYGWLLGYNDSPNTVRAYGTMIREWFAFCSSAGLDPLDAPRSLVEQYKAWLYDRGRKPATVDSRLGALSSFYRYCEDEELVRRSPLRGVRRPKIPDQSASTGLTREELRAFLAEARTRGPLMHLLMLLLGLNGLRASEPCTAQVDDLGTTRGHTTIMVQRKGFTQGAKSLVPLAPVTIEALNAWLPVRAQQLGQVGRGTGLLFFKFRYGNGPLMPIDRRDIYRHVRSIGKIAVPDKQGLHPHDLRHAFVTLSLDAGVPLRDVQDSAGHMAANTTRRYDRSRGEIDRHATYTLATYLGGGR
jgi:integrase/recombinase XerD